jgi:leukotriene A-4 hydrolase/aminopeptidase
MSAIPCGIRVLLSLAALLSAGNTVAAMDPHSYANIDDFRASHAALDLRADFERRELVGTVDLTLQRLNEQSHEVLLDTRELTIDRVELLSDRKPQPLTFQLGSANATLGAPLRITLPAQGSSQQIVVRIAYHTSPKASGLQWLTPAQTAGKQQPFLYSQSQAIHARSWIPLQDTPQVRLTYSAHIRTPKNLIAVMSAENEQAAVRDGDYSFRMPQPIPSYLFALAIGDLQFQPIGPRTGVYAEPATIAAASREFADLESMLTTCEKLFGPYRWGRYDLLILPPSFILGGMENPRLSFITPTVIAGDRSLVSLIAHELAHSWSGNLVTNASWDSIWLNEGFTTYLERRIIEVLYGADRRAMEDVLGLQSLQRDIAELDAGGDSQLTKLALDLRGRDPDDAFSDVAYEKGRLFAGFLEARLGRERFDAFLRQYFEHFAFKSVDNATFDAYLREHLIGKPGVNLTAVEIDTWLHDPGIPSIAVLPTSDAFAIVDGQRSAWLKGERSAKQLDTVRWTTHQWLHFLDNLPPDISTARLTQLDDAFHFTAATNSEIAHSWLKDAIRARYAPAYPRLEQYLTSIGRRKLVKDLYEDLLKTPDGARQARDIYAKARPLYQVPLAAQLDALMAGK